MKRLYIFVVLFISALLSSCSLDEMFDKTVTQQEIAGPWSWLDFTTTSPIYGFGEITIDQYGNFTITYTNHISGTEEEPSIETQTGTIKIASSKATVQYSDGTIVTSGKIQKSKQAQNRWLINVWEGKTSWADVVIGSGLTWTDRFLGGGGF